MSVIVPCYNYGRYLPETLTCIAAQTYANFECLVVDDGSTDNTRSVTETFSNKDKRFVYVHQKNQGLSAARNTGIGLSKGTFVQFLDADDLLHSQKLEIHVRALQLHGVSKVVFSDFSYFEDKTLGETLRSSQQTLSIDDCSHTEISADEAMSRMTTANLAVVNSLFVPSSQITATGLFETSYRSLEDWNYWFRMAVTGTTFIQLKCKAPLAFVRRHEASMSRQAATMLDSHAQLLRDMKQAFAKMASKGENLTAMVVKNQRVFRGSIIFEEIQHRDLSKGLSLAISSAFKSPRDFFWYLRNGFYSIKVRQRK